MPLTTSTSTQSMDVSVLTQLESCALELARAAKSLAEYSQTTSEAEPSNGLPTVASDGPSHAHGARRVILANVAKLQMLVSEPCHFLQELGYQVRITFQHIRPARAADPCWAALGVGSTSFGASIR